MLKKNPLEASYCPWNKDHSLVRSGPALSPLKSCATSSLSFPHSGLVQLFYTLLLPQAFALCLVYASFPFWSG